MTFLTRTVTCTVLGLFLASCGTGGTLSRASSDWNDAGVWRRLPGEADTYLPSDMADGVQTSSANGEWLVDKDGSRFFVPHNGTKAYTVGILRVEARKATDSTTWEKRRPVKLPPSPYANVSLIGPYTEQDAKAAAEKRRRAEESDIREDDTTTSTVEEKETRSASPQPSTPGEPPAEVPDREPVRLPRPERP
jgi:hypothetical protein